MREILPFILCGGSGTRLWPLSREAYPKQFHKITGPETLFQQTCRRLNGDLFGDLSVLSNHRHRFLIAEQLEEIGVSAANIVLEPVGRNTAPAACIAALIAARDRSEFARAARALRPRDPRRSRLRRCGRDRHQRSARGCARHLRRRARLPTYGLRLYRNREDRTAPRLPVTRFVEKPSRETAEAFLDSGRFYWNAGIFLFKAATLLELLQTHAPEILAACRRALNEATKDLDFLAVG